MFFESFHAKGVRGNPLAALLPGIGLAAAALPSPAEAQVNSGVKKLISTVSQPTRVSSPAHCF